MRDEIRPALTPEEWDAAKGRYYWDLWADLIGTAGAPRPNGPRLHAAAALALDGQSFGFTGEDLMILSRGVPRSAGYHEVEWNDAEIAAADRALAKIAALLPQESAR